MVGNKRVVLIIDDTAEDRATWQRFLAQDNTRQYTFLEASQGSEGLRLYSAARPDCVLLADRLPDRDELTMLKTMIKDARRPACPVVILAGAGTIETAVQAMQLGAHNYLLKNKLTPTELQQAVTQAIGKVQLVHDLTVEPLHDPSGQIIGITSAAADGTDHWLIEEQQLRILLELLPVGAWLTDAQGSIVLDNPASQRIWGVRHAGQDHYGQYKGWWADSGQPLKSEDWSLSRALTTGESFLNEMIDIETFDGERKTILNSVVPIKTTGGQVLGAVVVNEDVTHLRRIEQALRQSEERYRLAAEAERAARLEAEAAQQSLTFMAEIRERNRLAQELHDNVAQALGYLNLKMTVVRELLADHKLDEVEINLRELKQIVNETYADIRGEIFNLRTDPISAVNFLETLRQYLDKYKRFYHLEVELIFETDEARFDFPSEVSIALIRTIQEALMNVRKHAQVNQAVIRLGEAGNVLYISVEDQGRGFEVGAIARQSTSYGVNIMRERLEAVGGNLEIVSAPGDGTRINLFYPRR